MRRGVWRWGRDATGRVSTAVLAAILLAAILLALTALPAQAQTSRLAEQMRAQRAKVRMQEIAGGMGLAAVPRGPVEMTYEPSEAASLLFWWLPRSRTPRVELDSLVVVAAPEPEPTPMVPALTTIAWDRVGPAEQAAFLDRFREALWTVEGMQFHTALDTIPTPELRARLFGHFGAPTRTAVARSVAGFEGSQHVQFEYWFVVNDSIPFVALDADGPFGRGLVLAGDFAHAAVLGAVKRDFVRRLLTRGRLMPYVDYYHSRERNQWYRTGYDGADYYVEEIKRPRWVRRRSEDGKWYLFR